MEFYAVKGGINPGIYTNLFEVFKNLKKDRKRRGYAIYTDENKARKYMGYPIADEDAKVDVRGMIDYSFNEVKDGSIKKYNQPIKKNGCVAYVDGSYNKNKKIYGAGVVFMTPDGRVFTRKESYCDKYKKYTSASGEVLAVIMAIDMAIDFGYTNITIYHDVTLPAPDLKGRVRAKSTIMKMFLEYLNSVRCLIHCKFKKVKAHTGDYYNTKADHLAGLASGIRRHVLVELEENNFKRELTYARA